MEMSEFTELAAKYFLVFAGVLGGIRIVDDLQALRAHLRARRAGED